MHLLGSSRVNNRLLCLDRTVNALAGCFKSYGHGGISVACTTMHIIFLFCGNA